MKQYIMGMLTGASLILCAVMFIGASSGSNGKYQITMPDAGKLYLLDTATGQVFIQKYNPKGDGFIWEKYSTPYLDKLFK
tara:strand:+ start:1053 stop:1292 length:240 start_codon:yes stop_codon:yes gene_type:complete